jgi:hypothetical protein
MVLALTGHMEHAWSSHPATDASWLARRLLLHACIDRRRWNIAAYHHQRAVTLPATHGMDRHGWTSTYG